MHISYSKQEDKTIFSQRLSREYFLLSVRYSVGQNNETHFMKFISGKKNGRLVDGLYIIITIYNCRRSDKQLKRHLTARKRMRKCTHANRTRRLQMALEGNPKWKSKKLPVGFALETIPKRPKLEQ